MKDTRKARTGSPWGRLKLVGAGLALAGVGWARQLRNIQVVKHSTGQPMFSWGLIGAGLLCLILAFIPTTWVAKAAEIPRAKTGRNR